MISVETTSCEQKTEIPNRSLWYSKDEIQGITGWSERTLWRKLSALSETQLRDLPRTSRGRPERLYHYSSFPQTIADWQLNRSGIVAPAVTEDESPAPERSAISADDLAIAQLRLQAVKEYEARLKLMPEAVAVKQTCEDWTKKQRKLAVQIDEHLPGGFIRKADETVSLGNFSTRTLQVWRSLYNRKKDLLILVPEKKGNVGRKTKEIPEDLFSFVYMLATSTPRANVKLAIDYALETAKEHWPRDQWPDISLRTWQRRILAFDPRKAGRDLMHSISKFRKEQSPDVEMDWTKLPYNGRWEIDDVQKDWYAHALDLQRTLRPYAYAIIRTRTRQWVAVVTSECRITQEQVRTLIGTAMASSQGGIPDLIKFERGTVARDPHLDNLLHSFGVKTSSTGMDDGAALPGLLADIASGHFQGKGVIESNFRKLHNLEAFQLGQVGANERDTAPARTENLRRLSEQYAREGRKLLLPAPEEWHNYIVEMLNKHNNTPHGSLPETIDPLSGEKRHLTPNEMAEVLKDDPVRIMDEKCLPMFYAKGDRVTVTRNGFTLNKLSYGRFDDELKLHREVTAYATSDCPRFAFVLELGRSVPLYEKASPYEDNDQFGKKRHQEKQFRNKFEETVAKAINSAGSVMIQNVRMTDNPVPGRPSTVVSDETLVRQAAGINGARTRQRKVEAESRSRFAPISDSPEVSKRFRRHSLLETADKIADQLMP